MWWMAVALAAGPAWVQGQATLPDGFVPRAVLDTPTGSIAVQADTWARIDAAGAVITSDLPYTWQGDPTDVRCDVDGDGWEDLLTTAAAPYPTFFQDVRTGRTMPALERSATMASGEMRVTDCADLDGDGRVEIVGFVPEGAIALRMAIWSDVGVLEHEWWLAADSVSGRAVVGELDGDPTPELVLPDGSYVDAVTLLPEGALPITTTGLTLVDMDGDGRDEAFFRDGVSWSVHSPTVSWASTLNTRLAAAGDFDGDGNGEVVLIGRAGVSFSRFHVLDGVTGRRRFPPVDAQPCGDMRPHDHDGDGVYELLCSAADLRFDPVTGELAFLLGYGAQDLVPHTGDLDGDGSPEVVWVSDTRAVVSDPRGQVLDVLPLLDGDDGFSVANVDGTPGDELLRAGTVWTWTRPGGFVEAPYSPLPLTTAACVREVGDFDGDGSLEVLTDTCAFPQRVRLLRLDSGAVLDLGPGTERASRTTDLDGDGVREILVAGTTGVSLYRPDGSLLTTFPGVGATVAASNTLVVTDGQALTAWQLGPSGPRQLGRRVTGFQPGDPRLQWGADRLWYRRSPSLTVGWSPTDGSELVLAAATPYAPLVIAEDIVWVGENGFDLAVLAP
jgi:hypothetical protein